MLTRIEIETMELVKAACRHFIDEKRTVDWEQRRYEIAMRVFSIGELVTAEQAVQAADALIAELKKPITTNK